MTKAELIEKVSKDAKVTKVAAGKSIDAIIDGISMALKKGDRVSLVGFGSFSVSNRKARTGRNPQTGKPIKIAARKVARFKAGSALRKAVR